MPALIVSARNGHTDIVKSLIDAGANLDLQNNQQTSALMFSAYFGHTDIVKLLIDAGAN